MENTIVNRISKSPIVNIDLAMLRPQGDRVLLDISEWLDQKFILREKYFRNKLKQHCWSQYDGSYVAINCSTDAILPSWAFILVASHLQPRAKMVVHGNLVDLEKRIFFNAISNLNLETYQDKPVMINGCSESKIPEDTYVQLINRLQGVARSIFFGEACSSVPIWKRKK